MNLAEINQARAQIKARNRAIQLKNLERKVEKPLLPVQPIAPMNEPRASTLPLLPPNGEMLGKGEGRRRRRRNRNLRRRMALQAWTNVPGVEVPRLRDGTLGNPMDPRTTMALRQMGQTSLGAHWVLRALHPCGEGLNLVPKIPDGALSESVILERRDEFDIKTPWVDDQNATWSVVVISVPTLRTPLMVIAWNGSVEGSDLQSMLSKLISVSGDAIDRDVNESYRYPSWGTVSKQGKVLSNVRGQLMKMANLDTGFKAQNADKQFITCRRTYAGMTIDTL